MPDTEYQIQYTRYSTEVKSVYQIQYTNKVRCSTVHAIMKLDILTDTGTVLVMDFAFDRPRGPNVSILRRYFRHAIATSYQ